MQETFARCRSRGGLSRIYSIPTQNDCREEWFPSRRTAQVAQLEECIRYPEVSGRYAVSPGRHGMVAAEGAGRAIITLPGRSYLCSGRIADERIPSPAFGF